jgi:hypothetical protein
LGNYCDVCYVPTASCCAQFIDGKWKNVGHLFHVVAGHVIRILTTVACTLTVATSNVVTIAAV